LRFSFAFLPRLEQVYADKTEGELRSIARDASALTSEARRVLNDEIARRGLDIAVSTWVPTKNATSQTEFTTRQGKGFLFSV